MASVSTTPVMEVVNEVVCEFLNLIEIPEAEHEPNLLMFLGMLMKKGLVIVPASAPRPASAAVAVAAAADGAKLSLSDQWKLVSAEDKAYWKAVGQVVDVVAGKAHPSCYGAFTVFKGCKETVDRLTRDDGTIGRPK